MILPLGAEHLADLLPLCAQLGYPADLPTLARRLAALGPDDRALVYVEGGKITAWIHGTVDRGLTEDPRALITALVVDEARRGRGQGRALVAALEAWARERGLGKIRVRSQIKREGAHRFYEGLGYARAKTSHIFTKELETP